MNHKVQRVLDYLEDKTHEKTRRAELAKVAGVSPAHLSMLFKKSTGKTITAYLTEMKMRRAKDLLETSCLSVKEIMNRVGRSDVSHFARDFKKPFGVTPTELRARSGQSEDLAGW